MKRVDVPRVGTYVTHTHWSPLFPADLRYTVVGLVVEVYPNHNVVRTKPASGRGYGSWDPIVFPRRIGSRDEGQWYELEPITRPPAGPPAQPLPDDPRVA